MNKVKKPTVDSASLDARRKSFITVLARVLARDLELIPAVAKKPKQKKECEAKAPK